MRRVGILYNNIHPGWYWDQATEGIILHGTSMESFWATKIEVPYITKDTVFLDLGCGIGRMAESVHDKVKEYVGVDFSEGMLTRARTIHMGKKNVSFVKNNGLDLSVLQDKYFDVAYSHLVFQHITIDTMKAYINDCYRVLKKIGIFILENVPVKGKYVNGVTMEELHEMCSKFKIIKSEMNTDGYYYDIHLRKESK